MGETKQPTESLSEGIFNAMQLRCVRTAGVTGVSVSGDWRVSFMSVENCVTDRGVNAL